MKLGNKIKEKVNTGWNTIKTSGKNKIITGATVVALSGALVSCDSQEKGGIHVSVDGNKVSTTFVFQTYVGGGEFETSEYDVKITNEDGIYTAKIDGPWRDDHTFTGSQDEVFSQLQNLMQQASDRITGSEEVSQKVDQKIFKMQSILGEQNNSEQE